MKSSAIFSMIMFLIPLGFILLALDYQKEAKLVPLIIGIPALILAFIQFLCDAMPEFKDQIKRSLGFRQLNISGKNEEVNNIQSRLNIYDKFQKGIIFPSWLILFMGLVYILGYMIAIPIFLVLFLKYWVHANLSTIIFITGLTWLFIYVVFIIVMRAPLHEGVLIQMIR